MAAYTSQELCMMRDAGQLTPGAVYEVSDYDFTIYMTAASEYSFTGESTDSSGRLIHYVPDRNEIDYLQDPVNHIDGYFDWTENWDGKGQYISFGHSPDVEINGSSNITLGPGNSGTITACSDLVVGSNNTLDLATSHNMTIGDDNEFEAAGCSNITIGNANTLTLNSIEGVSFTDSNSSINIHNGNTIVGSRNKDITVTGLNNTICSDCVRVEVPGSLNRVEASRFSKISGLANMADKAVLSNIDGVGNTLSGNGIDIKGTNNCSVYADNIELSGRKPFLGYTAMDGLVIVRGLAESRNLRSDVVGDILVYDIQRKASELDSGKRYRTDNKGRWAKVYNNTDKELKSI